MFDFRETLIGRSLAAVLSASLATSSLVACSGAPGDDPSATGSSATESKPETTKAFDGESVFRGVFFGRGAVGAILPDLWADGAALGERAAADPHVLAEQVDQYIATLCERGCSDATRDGLRSASERLRSGEKDQIVAASPNAAFTRSQGPAFDAAINAVVGSIQWNDPTFLERFGADMQSGNPVRVKNAVEDATHRLVDAATQIERASGGKLNLGVHPQPSPNADGDDGPFIVYVVVAVAVLVVLVAALPDPMVKRAGDTLDYDRFIASLTDRLQHG